jgi:hypothetical protein
MLANNYFNFALHSEGLKNTCLRPIHLQKSWVVDNSKVWFKVLEFCLKNQQMQVFIHKGPWIL